MIVGDIIERNARLYPNRPALVFEDRRFSHRQFAERVYRLANGLIAQGLRPGERIALLAQNCSQGLEIFGAAEVAGFIIVPLNYRLAHPEMAAVLADCQPAILIYEEHYRDAAHKLAAAQPSIRLMIAIDGAAATETDTATGLLYEALLAGERAERPAQRPEPEDIAYLIYTSGTTGRPKGVMLSHRALVSAARSIAYEGTAPTDRMLIVMPMYHIGGKIEQLAFSIRGAAIILQRAFTPEGVLAAMQSEKVTTAHLAPVMIQRILDVPDLRRYDLGSVRLIHYASAPMSVALLRRAIAGFGLIFAQVYGMTEAVVGTILQPHQHVPEGDEAEVRRLASAGQPFFGTELRVVRPDGSDCAPEEIGEVLIGGGGVMSGYWNNTQQTQETLRHGWLSSGDMGFFDAEGFLFVADRKKDMILSGGENIYSREVEEALLTHPAVAEAAVIGVPDRDWGEAVKACVVVRPGQRVEPAALIEHCRTLLASYKKPRSVDYHEALPRLHNGKIDKKALRAPYWGSEARQIS